MTTIKLLVGLVRAVQLVLRVASEDGAERLVVTRAASASPWPPTCSNRRHITPVRQMASVP
jgi:hypothetical protein